MKLPITWLKDYVKTNLSAAEIAEKLNGIGFEVEEIINEGGEFILDVSVTPNRADCQSILGLAREVAAATGAPFVMPELTFVASESKNPFTVKVEDAELCPRYTGAYMGDISVAESPEFIKNRLKWAGVKPINNIVDITNFVLLEFGQPMHAFDAECVAKNTIIVRRAREGEELTALDGNKYGFCADELLIADKERAIGIAGIMGGANSLITEKTAAVFFESAVFNHVSIRKTSRRLALRSDSSARFEKGIDSFSCEYALRRALHLAQMLKAGKIYDGILDAGKPPAPAKAVKVTTEEIGHLLGIEIAPAKAVKILNSLFIESELSGKTITARPPYWRTDIAAPCDLIEEIIRIHGYNKLRPALLERASVTNGGRSARQKAISKIKDFLVSAGLFEVATLSFTGRKMIEKTGINFEQEKKRLVPILNPLGEDFAYLRHSNVANILNIVSLNLARKNEAASYYEIANNFSLRGNINEQAEERLTLTAASIKDDFHFLKEVVEGIAKIVGKEAEFNKAARPFLHPGVSAEILVNGKPVGVAGQLHPAVAANFEINKAVTLLELDIDALTEGEGKDIKYRPVSKFPSVTRDISLLLNNDIEVGKLIEYIKCRATEILRTVTLTDLYTGGQIKEGKSATIKLEFLSDARTLQQAEVDEALAEILRGLNAKFGATLRS